MTAPPETVPTEALLAQSAWLHRLARQLVRDEAGAEDAVQETLVAALERERAGRVPGRAWLASVLRNVARLRARSGARRAAREGAHARAGATEHPAADELLLRLEAQRRLVEAVAGLEEPYRSTVALRYLEALAPREIARRQGIPVKTVKTRLERGLARLRERLDRAYGSRGAWCAALGGLGRAAAPAAALGTAAMGGLAMGTALKWTAAAAAVVLAGVAVERARNDAREPVRPAAKGSAEAPREAAVLDAAVADGGDGRVSVPAPAARVAPDVQPAVAAPERAPAAAPPVLTGLVVDTAGLPIAGAEVVLLADPGATPTEQSFETQARALSDRDGAFELQGFAGTGRLHARAPGLATVVAPALVWVPPPAPPVVVLGPERNYGGRVVDEQGRGLGDVALMLLLRPGTQPPGVDAMAWMCGPFVQTSSSSDGSFRLPPAGFARGMTLVAFAPGYAQQNRDAGHYEMGMALQDADNLELVVRLERDPLADVLAGRVVDAEGRGVARAFVAAQVPEASGLLPGYLAATTDEEGAFRIAAEGSPPRPRCARPPRAACPRRWRSRAWTPRPAPTSCWCSTECR